MELSVANFTQCLRDEESYLKFYFITNDDGHMPRDVKKAYDVSFHNFKMRSRNANFILYTGNKRSMSSL